MEVYGYIGRTSIGILGKYRPITAKYATKRAWTVDCTNSRRRDGLAFIFKILDQTNSSPKMLIVKLYIQILTFTTQYTFENLHLWPRMHANIEIQYTWPPGAGKLDITMAWVGNRPAMVDRPA